MWNMSLSAANLIHAWAFPILVIGAALTLAGTIGVFVSDGVRARYALQAEQAKTAKLQTPAPRSPPHYAEPAPETTAALAYIAPRPAPSPVNSFLAPAPPAPPTPAKTQMADASAKDPTPMVTPEGGDKTAPARPETVARKLGDRQRKEMLSILMGAPEEDIWIVTERDPEAQHYAAELGAVFREAGWSDHHAVVLHPGHSTGGLSVALHPTPADSNISRAFAAAGLSVTSRRSSSTEPTPTLYVGSQRETREAALEHR